MKIIKLLVAIFLFSSSFVIAQKQSYIGIEAALTASESYIIGTDQVDPELVRIVNNLIQHKVNWNFAFTYAAELKENVLFKTGLEVASQGFIIRDVFLTDENGNAVGVVSEINNTLYLGIPLALRVEFPVAKIAPYIEVGIAPSIAAIDNSVVTDFTTFQTNRRFEPRFDRFALASNFAIGSNFLLSEKYTLYAQIHSQTMLIDFYRENELNGIFYSVGLRAGVRMAM